MATVLVVDDRPPDRHLLVTLLQHARHRVLEAADGAQALRLVRAERPDLLVSDVLLPQMDGYEIVRQLRADPATAQTTVIFYTAMFGEQEAQALAKDIGVARVLSKPTDPEKILATVAEVLEAKAAEEISTPPANFDNKHQQLLLDKLLWQIEALQQSEEREHVKAAELQALLDAVPAYIFLAQDPDCHYMTGNSMTYELLRLPPGSNVSQSAGADDWPGHFHIMKNGRDIPPQEMPIQRAVKGQRVRDYELDLVFDDGTVRCMLGNALPLLEKSGRPLGAVGAFIDITAHRQLEAALKKAQGDLERRVEERTAELKRALEERSQLALIVESSDDAIIGKTLDGIITSWNSGAQKLYGYTQEEVSGRPISILAPPDGHDEVHRLLEKIRTREAIDHFETVRLRKNGERIYVSLTISPILDADGKLVGSATIGRDITENKRTEEEIRELNEKLEQRVEERTAELEAANKELESFSYSVSHDLKTPLRAIEGFSRMLMREHTEKLDAEGLRLLRVVCDNTKLMQQLIDDLLALARLGRQQLRKSTISLGEMARQVFERLKIQAPQRRLKLIVKEPSPAYADHSLLYQVMTNLLDNAIKYTQAKETAVIEVGGWAEGQETICYVKDNGIGFDERYGDKIFGPFQRLHEAAKYDGTGIGLAIVQRIIERHGGRVWAEGKLDHGATFYFTLPKNGA